jgi:hypothetical protein
MTVKMMMTDIQAYSLTQDSENTMALSVYTKFWLCWRWGKISNLRPTTWKASYNIYVPGGFRTYYPSPQMDRYPFLDQKIARSPFF